LLGSRPFSVVWYAPLQPPISQHRQSERTQLKAYVSHYECNLSRIISSKIALAGCARIYPSQEWQTRLPTRKAGNSNEKKPHRLLKDTITNQITCHSPYSTRTALHHAKVARASSYSKRNEKSGSTDPRQEPATPPRNSSNVYARFQVRSQR
jgi:hypothetical protein